ncbi:MAG: CPXCG motif-containing cysteine-rich protein [Gammaproteobacteria bacterium]|nr:CPXCG motif-containing cysteine-rich protein [Gammaproteobacteria bacterium]
MYNEHDVSCPYCGETFTSFIDISQGSHNTVEDCYVCCRPIEFVIEINGGEVTNINTYTDDESVF